MSCRVMSCHTVPRVTGSVKVVGRTREILQLPCLFAHLCKTPAWPVDGYQWIAFYGRAGVVGRWCNSGFRTGELFWKAEAENKLGGLDRAATTRY